MKKKIVVALLACAMISLTACNSDKAETEETTTTEESTTTAETPDSSSVDDSFYTSDLDLSVDGEPTIENPLIETDGVAVGDYKNIVIDKVEVTEVTDEDVQSEFDSYMAVYNEEVEVTDRDALQEGDIADIDFVGKIDGEAFEGGSSEGYRLELGSGSFIEGFEEGLVGVKKGEKKDLNLTFPADYYNTEYAGKAVVFEVTVNGIYQTVEPEVTDEFVAEKTDFDSIQAYKDDIRSSMEESNESTAKNTRRTNIWTEIISKAAVKKYDEEEVKKYILDYKKYMENMIYSSYNMTFDAYLSTSGMEPADFKETAVTNAVAAAKEQMVIDAIATEEGLEVTEEDYQEYLKEYIAGVGVTSEDELWSKFEEQGSKKEDIIESMKDAIRAEKVMEFVEKTVVEK
ncbi:MAG: trigger factor [Lachnospiraceae bacterium]|nr:trigger factor [Lachnospiraceae bacterium]